MTFLLIPQRPHSPAYTFTKKARFILIVRAGKYRKTLRCDENYNYPLKDLENAPFEHRSYLPGLSLPNEKFTGSVSDLVKRPDILNIFNESF